MRGSPTCFKPGYYQSKVGPHLKRQRERDSELEQTETCCVLCSSIAYDGYNSDIEQINEEFERSHFFLFGCSPEKAFVPILTYANCFQCQNVSFGIRFES